MEDKFLCVMAGYDEKTEEILDQLQKHLYQNGFHGRQTKNLPPHITLGIFPLEKEKEVRRILEEKVTKRDSFSVSFQHIGLFGGGEVLFVSPNASVELLTLQELFGTSLDFTPHSTLLIDTKETILKALPLVEQNFFLSGGR